MTARTERLKALYDRHRSAQSDASTGESFQPGKQPARRCVRNCRHCRSPDRSRAELRDALQGRLNEAVRSLDRDRWMFEPEDDEH